jgi:hypothetical protein
MTDYPFTVYDQASGEVLRTGKATMLRDALIQARAGEAIIAGQWPRGEYREAHPIPPPAPPAVAVEDVKELAFRLLQKTDWYVFRAQDPEGAPVPQAVWDYRAAVRIASGAIEAMEPIPLDYADAKYWPDQL